ncbi:MAG TPA: STAS domain-containing protein [Terriglobales bacterium]|nr:STAS domain-containing protein [Terriglobales bacterium]
MLSIDVLECGEVAMLFCRGSLMAGETAEHFRRIAIAHSEATLLVDIAELEKIDAAGVGVWLDIHNKAEHRGGSMILLNPTVWVREFLQLTHLDSVLRIVARQEQAPRANERTLVQVQHVAA